MIVVSPARYKLRGGLILEKGENVVPDKISPVAKVYLDGMIKRGVLRVIEKSKPAEVPPALSSSAPSASIDSAKLSSAEPKTKRGRKSSEDRFSDSSDDKSSNDE